MALVLVAAALALLVVAWRRMKRERALGGGRDAALYAPDGDDGQRARRREAETIVANNG